MSTQGRGSDSKCLTRSGLIRQESTGSTAQPAREPDLAQHSNRLRKGVTQTEQSEETMQTTPRSTPGRPPVAQFRLGGLKAAVWRNEVANLVRFNATFSRLYKENEEWRESDSFGRDDLLALAKLADQVHTWMCEQNAKRESDPMPKTRANETGRNPRADH